MAGISHGVLGGNDSAVRVCNSLVGVSDSMAGISHDVLGGRHILAGISDSLAGVSGV